MVWLLGGKWSCSFVVVVVFAVGSSWVVSKISLFWVGMAGGLKLEGWGRDGEWICELCKNTMAVGIVASLCVQCRNKSRMRGQFPSNNMMFSFCY